MGMPLLKAREGFSTLQEPYVHRAGEQPSSEHVRLNEKLSESSRV